jgi:hypothetical protein
MVYGFAKQSNGHVSIYSEPGLGTTVRLYLPRVATDVPRAAEQDIAEEEAAPGGHETILVAEETIPSSGRRSCAGWKASATP